MLTPYPNIDSCSLNDDGTVAVRGRFISEQQEAQKEVTPNPDAPVNTQLSAVVTQLPNGDDSPSGSGQDTFSEGRHAWVVQVTPVGVPFAAGWAWITAQAVRAYADRTTDTLSWSRWIRIEPAPS